MSTSILEGRVALDAALYGAGNDPLDTAIVRDGVANGLLHAADVCGQVRVAYMPMAAAVGGNDRDAYETIESTPTPVNDTWYRLGASPFGSWPLTLDASGQPYKLRIRCGVAASASNATTLTVRVVIAPIDEAAAVAELRVAEDHVWETSWTASATSTTPTWATGTSQGVAASATLLSVDADRAAEWTRSAAIFDAVSSASPRSTQQCLVAAHVWGKGSGAASGTLPRLHSLFIAEYLAP